jgi:hypothetical protein
MAVFWMRRPSIEKRVFHHHVAANRLDYREENCRYTPRAFALVVIAGYVRWSSAFVTGFHSMIPWNRLDQP